MLEGYVGLAWSLACWALPLAYSLVGDRGATCAKRIGYGDWPRSERRFIRNGTVLL
jgi:hypothetical protein